MSFGIALDVAIGLILTYLLLGMLASTCQELIVGAVKLRGRKLFGAIESLLEDGKPVTEVGSLANRVKSHTLIRPLKASEIPSYVPAKNFALAVIDCLSGSSTAPVLSAVETAVAALPPSAAKTSLTTFLKRSGGDIDVLQTDLQTWFDDAMDRVGGDFKRWSQYFLLVFGLVAAVAFNVDSIRIATALWVDPTLRSSVADVGSNVAKDKPPTESGTSGNGDDARALLGRLNALQLPIGWTSPPGAAATGQGSVADVLHRGFGVWTIAGWLLTAFGVSLGAPFWFNVLKQAVSMRSSGPKPPRADA